MKCLPLGTHRCSASIVSCEAALDSQNTECMMRINEEASSASKWKKINREMFQEQEMEVRGGPGDKKDEKRRRARPKRS